MTWVLQTIQILFGLALIVVSGTGDQKNQDTTRFLRPTKSILNFTLGYNEIIADSFWIRLVQDFGSCDKQRLESRDSYQENTLGGILNAKSRVSSCPNSWVFHMSDLIMDLSPGFEFAYIAAATNLIVSVDDLEGGQKIIERGIKSHPRNWKLAYIGAYFYIYELKDIQRAADLLLHAHQNGGPAWLPVLASRLYYATDRKKLAQSVLEEYIHTAPGGEAEERARKKLQEIKDADTGE
jgi:hypothetical protein